LRSAELADESPSASSTNQTPVFSSPELSDGSASRVEARINVARLPNPGIRVKR